MLSISLPLNNTRATFTESLAIFFCQKFLFFQWFFRHVFLLLCFSFFICLCLKRMAQGIFYTWMLAHKNEHSRFTENVRQFSHFYFCKKKKKERALFLFERWFVGCEEPNTSSSHSASESRSHSASVASNEWINLNNVQTPYVE